MRQRWAATELTPAPLGNGGGLSPPPTGQADATALRWVLTAQGGSDRLTEQVPLASAAGINCKSAGEPGSGLVSNDHLASIFVDTQRRFQLIEGFGGAFTEAAAVSWQGLDAARRDTLLRAYFDPSQGHGYTLCRVHMNSCDFALGNYAHAEVPGDLALQHFNIARDRQALLPFIQAALAVAGRPVKLLVSPWSPPAWMKDSGRMNGGGQLLPQCAAAWAQCFVRFIQAYQAEGVPVWGVSVQNEPEAIQRWDSCCYTAQQERDFVRDHLGPALAAAGLGQVKIIVWDHNRDRMVERASVVYQDAAAARYVWGTGFHWYGEDCFDNVQLLHDAWPDKQLLFTEGCQEGGPHAGSWALGERYARSMINDLNRWTAGWIDWNLVLDETGGPNHVANLCSAPVLVDRADGQLLWQNSYFYIGHFARFVQAGARRVLCAATRQALECTAFVNPDGSSATVVMNRSEGALDFVLRIDGRDFVARLPARAIASFLGAPAGHPPAAVPALN